MPERACGAKGQLASICETPLDAWLTRAQATIAMGRGLA
jgi:hypothetical protein